MLQETMMMSTAFVTGIFYKHESLGDVFAELEKMSVPLDGVRAGGLKSCFSRARDVTKNLYIWVTQTYCNREPPGLDG